MQQPEQTGAPRELTLRQIERAVEAMTPLVPIEHAVWGAKEIAAYLRVSARHVTERLSMRPDFPQPRRTSPGSSKGHLRWQAIEVIRWWEEQDPV